MSDQIVRNSFVGSSFGRLLLSPGSETLLQQGQAGISYGTVRCTYIDVTQRQYCQKLTSLPSGNTKFGGGTAAIFPSPTTFTRSCARARAISEDAWRGRQIFPFSPGHLVSPDSIHRTSRLFLTESTGRQSRRTSFAGQMYSVSQLSLFLPLFRVLPFSPFPRARLDLARNFNQASVKRFNVPASRREESQSLFRSKQRFPFGEEKIFFRSNYNVFKKFSSKSKILVEKLFEFEENTHVRVILVSTSYRRDFSNINLLRWNDLPRTSTIFCPKIVIFSQF